MGIKKLNRRKRRRTDKLNIGSINMQSKLNEQEKKIFDLNQLLEISRSLSSLLEFNRLIEAILYVVMAQMKTFGVAIFTKKNFDDDTFILHSDFYGFDISHEKRYAILEDHPIIEFLSKKNRCVFPKELKAKFSDLNDGILDMLLQLGPSLFIPLKAKNRIMGVLLLGEQIEDINGYDIYEQDIIMNISSLAAIAISNSQLLEMTTTDIMTRLKMKHYFYAVLDEKLETINELSSLSVLMFDIDNFKGVNDTYGHGCGDIVLQQVACVIMDSIRQTDLAARYGGEEFIVLLTEADYHASEIIAERIRKGVENMEIVYDDTPIKVTISIGIAEYLHNGENTKKIVNRADVALYESKTSGKNRYTISKENLQNK